MSAWLTLYGPIVVACAVLAGFVFVAILRRIPEPVDRAWRATGIRQTFSGYDASKAVASAKRAAELAERQRLLASQRAGIVRTVTPPAEVMRGDFRRKTR